MHFCDPLPGEDHTWHEASDEAWGKRAAAAYAAAVKRGDDGQSCA